MTAAFQNFKKWKMKWFEMFDRSAEWGHWTGEILKAQMGFWNKSWKLKESNRGKNTQLIQQVAYIGMVVL